MSLRKVQFDINEFKEHFNYFIVDKILICIREKFADLSHEEVVNFLDKLYLLYVYSKSDNMPDFEWLTKIIDIIKTSSPDSLHKNFCRAFNLKENFFYDNNRSDNFSDLMSLEKKYLSSRNETLKDDEDLFMLKLDDNKTQEFFDKMSSDIKKMIFSEFIDDYKKIEVEMRSFYESQINEIKQNSQEIVNRYRNLKKIFEDSSANLQVLVTENEQLKKDLFFSKEQIRNLIAKFNEDTNNYRRDVYNLQEMIGKKNNDIVQLVDLKNKIVDSLNNSLHVQSENLNKQISDKEQELSEQYESKIIQVKKIIDDKKEIIDNLNLQIADLNRNLLAIKSENKKSASQISKYSNQIKKYESRISTLKNDNANKLNKIKTVTLNNKDLLKQISSYKNLMKKNTILETSIEKLFKEQKNLKDLLKSEKDDKQQSFSNLSKKITDVKERISSLKNDIKTDVSKKVVEASVKKERIKKDNLTGAKVKNLNTLEKSAAKKPSLKLHKTDVDNENISHDIINKLGFKKNVSASKEEKILKRESKKIKNTPPPRRKKTTSKISKPIDKNNRSLVNIFNEKEDIIGDLEQVYDTELIKIKRNYAKNKVYKKKIIP